jgi:cytochrome oxidase assembly protein ShyY1
VLLRPRWVVGHVLVLAVVVTFTSLGLWQLDRHREERDAERAARETAENPQVTGVDVRTVTDSDAEGRRTVRASGTYDPHTTVFVRDRVRGDATGVGVLTALVLDDGRAVVVDRGFLPGDPDEAGADANPPTGTVEVSGPARLPQSLQGGESATPEGDPPAVDRVDPTALGDPLDVALLPIWITLAAQRPEPAADGPIPSATVIPDESGYDVNHLSYALQWFGLALVPLVGWPILLRRVAEKERGATRSARRGDPPRRAGGGTR